MKRSIVVDITARLILPSAFVFAIHLLIVGHNAPGGGFVGGLVAGAAVAFTYVAGGIAEVRNLLRPAPWTVLGVGLLVAAGTALGPVLVGRPVLDAWSLAIPLGVLGKAKISGALIFDIGVAAVVIGLVLMIMEAFGEESRPVEETQ